MLVVNICAVAASLPMVIFPPRGATGENPHVRSQHFRKDGKWALRFWALTPPGLFARLAASVGQPLAQIEQAYACSIGRAVVPLRCAAYKLLHAPVWPAVVREFTGPWTR